MVAGDQRGRGSVRLREGEEPEAQLTAHNQCRPFRIDDGEDRVLTAVGAVMLEPLFRSTHLLSECVLEHLALVLAPGALEGQELTASARAGEIPVLPALRAVEPLDVADADVHYFASCKRMLPQSHRTSYFPFLSRANTRKTVSATQKEQNSLTLSPTCNSFIHHLPVVLVEFGPVAAVKEQPRRVDVVMLH